MAGGVCLMGLLCLLWTAEGAVAAAKFYDFTEGCCSGQVMLGEARDAVSGSPIRLPCRFHSALASSTTQYFWSREGRAGGKDNAAINAAPLDHAYSVDFKPEEGRYDLLIAAADYDRDDGKFECWLKEGGSGLDIYSVSYHLTVLIPPGPPRITPPNPVAREGEPSSLTCSSEGGNPDPQIRWYRDGLPLQQAQVQKGGARERPTASVLTVTPRLEDDGVAYRCVVWNRALKRGEEDGLEASVTLRVHYSPRVSVGPTNPLRVLEDGDAHLSCSVTASPPARTVRWVRGGHVVSNSHNHTIRGVTAEHSGNYSCVADNGVGEPTRADLELLVLYGPQVKVPAYQEVSAGEPLTVRCDVRSRPPPHLVQWVREGDALFRQTGETLRISRVSLEDGGRYTCQASSLLRPSEGNAPSVEAVGNASVTVRIKHKPGQAEISPSQPVAIAGRPFTLSCTAHPLGWPLPDYTWWREGQSQSHASSGRSNYTLASAHASHEGRYFCQPSNALGRGGTASVYLTVHEPAAILLPLAPQLIRKDKERDFSAECRARGKPRPRARWLQNGQEISEDSGLFHVTTTAEEEADEGGATVRSVLAFAGTSRRAGLSPGDRGRYTCLFENGFGDPARSEMMLRIEHSPVVRHTYNRVAFDPGETAVLQCKMQAYPAPRFEWAARGRVLDEWGGGNYGTNVTDLGEDIYAGLLSIREVKEEDYGEYTCRASNQVGDDKKTIIKLVRKGAPDRPSPPELIEVSSDRVTLRWREGFDGGFPSATEHIVTYTEAESGRSRNESCRQHNPCTLTGLSAHTEYRFKVLAVNPRGYSPYSDEMAVTTKDMPRPSEAQYDKDTGYLTFHVEPSSLKLLAKIEARPAGSEQWVLQTMIQVIRSIEKVQLSPPPGEGFSDVRVKLCLESNDSWCGDAKLANPLDDEDLPSPRDATAGLSGDHLVVLTSAAGVAFLLLLLFFAVCCCWRRRNGQQQKEKKEFEMEATNVSRPKAVTPPYFDGGVVNKGLESVTDDLTKAGMMYGPDPDDAPIHHQVEPPWLRPADDLPCNEGSYTPYEAGLPNGYFYPEDYQPLTEEEMMNAKNSHHLHSPYYEVSGLPDPYTAEDKHQQQQQQHISLPYDDESGYSTPSSKHRRVIREIIV